MDKIFRWIKNHKLLSAFLFFPIFLFSIYLLRVPILRSIGNFLIYQDKPEKIDVAFVLSGVPYERSKGAAKLFHDGYAGHFICTGEMIKDDFRALKMEVTEGESTKRGLIMFGVPDSLIQVIPSGTSTFEEADVIKNFCKQNGIKRCMIISSAFHTRRVHSVFRKKFKGENIQLIIQPAPPADYSTDFWWKSEDGLIDVNNEYMKTLYYLWKY